MKNAPIRPKIIMACLLGFNTNQFIPCCAIPRQEGVYFNWNFTREVFVRSEKVVRWGFQARHNEHLAGCKEDKSSTHFYFLHFSSKGKRSEKRDKLGCFKHSTQVIAAGFDSAAEPTLRVTKDHKEGGLLILSKDDQCRISSSLKKDLTAVQNFQEVIAYLFEFGYDLALAPEKGLAILKRWVKWKVWA